MDTQSILSTHTQQAGDHQAHILSLVHITFQKIMQI